MRNLMKILGVALAVFLIYLLIGKYKGEILSRAFGGMKKTGNFLKIEEYLENKTITIELDGFLKNYSLGTIKGDISLFSVSGKISNLSFSSDRITLKDFDGNSSQGYFSELLSGNFKIFGGGMIYLEGFEGVRISGTFDVTVEGFEGKLRILSENVTIKGYSFRFEKMRGEIEIKDGKIFLKGTAEKVSFWRI